jgi:hypothetical protein
VVKSVGFVSLTILLASLGTPCSAKKEHAPLPSQVLATKTVYVENHGSARLKDATYGDLRNGKVKENPARLVPHRLEDNARIRFLSAAEETALRGAIGTKCPERLPEFVLALNTGLPAE